MELSKRAKIILLASVVLLLIGAASYRLASIPLVRCYLVSWSDLDNIASDVYVDPNMPESQRQALLSSIAAARERVATFYGEYTANPVIIAGHTVEVMKVYGGNGGKSGQRPPEYRGGEEHRLYNRAGKTYTTLVAAYIILGPDGASSVDVQAHELAHAEFSARIGHQNRDRFPNWFNEGLAVQFDHRYTEAEWQLRTDNGRTAPDVNQMGAIKYDDWLGYATAKHEVRRWLDVVDQDGFWALVQSVRSGDEFQEAYRSIERACTTAK